MVLRSGCCYCCYMGFKGLSRTVPPGWAPIEKRRGGWGPRSRHAWDTFIRLNISIYGHFSTLLFCLVKFWSQISKRLSPNDSRFPKLSLEGICLPASPTTTLLTISKLINKCIAALHTTISTKAGAAHTKLQHQNINNLHDPSHFIHFSIQQESIKNLLLSNYQFPIFFSV